MVWGNLRTHYFFFQIGYKLASTQQAEQVFKRFYPAERFAPPHLDGLSENDITSSDEPVRLPEAPPAPLNVKLYYTPEELNALALQFAKLTPDETFSVAELQGYLLNKKWDPQGAVVGMSAWSKSQLEEKARIKELKAKKRLQLAQKRKMVKELNDGTSRIPEENMKNNHNVESDDAWWIRSLFQSFFFFLSAKPSIIQLYKVVCNNWAYYAIYTYVVL